MKRRLYIPCLAQVPSRKEREIMVQESIEQGLLITSSAPAKHGTGDAFAADASAATTPAVVLSTFVVVCGSLCYGVTLAYPSPAQTEIMRDLDLSVGAYSVFGSIMTAGGMIGAVFCGKIAAVIGRRYTMALSDVFCIIGWLVIANAKNALWLDVGRLFTGLAVGMITFVVPVYIAEITPRNLRGAFSSANQLLVNCGFSLVYFFGNLISWRTIALMGAIPAVIQLVGLFFIPESPRWLACSGRQKEFEASLQYLRGKDADISEEAEEIRDITKTFKKQSEARFLDLFQRRYALSLIVGVGLMFLQQLSGNVAIASYTSSIFEKADFSPLIGTSVVAVVQVPVGVLSLFLIDISGRRILLMVSAAGMCFGYVFLGLSFWLQHSHHLNQLSPIMAFVGLLGNISSFSIGIAGIPWIIMSEIFPINLKASAGSLVSVVNWVTSWAVLYSFNFIILWSSSGTFFIFAGVCVAIVLFVSKLVPETKGRTLEEIQVSITHILQ